LICIRLSTNIYFSEKYSDQTQKLPTPVQTYEFPRRKLCNNF
jgi:hypothetical protein